jgi:hypothetical protein
MKSFYISTPPQMSETRIKAIKERLFAAGYNFIMTTDQFNVPVNHDTEVRQRAWLMRICDEVIVVVENTDDDTGWTHNQRMEVAICSNMDHDYFVLPEKEFEDLPDYLAAEIVGREVLE